MNAKREVYLDYAAATPIDPRVLSVVRNVEKKFWQNPSSIHKGGVEAAKYLNSQRKRVAETLFAHSDEIVFTSGGTESNNLAIQGLIKSVNGPILISSIDHSSIIETAKSLKEKVIFLPVENNGKIDLKTLKKELSKKPSLLSFGFVNGEIGTIQDVKEIMKMVRHHRKVNKIPTPFVHIDATQAASILSCEVHKLGVDLMTLDGAKIYGPKGVGMLFVRRGVPIKPVIYGGGQEGGFRSGTENLPAIAGFAEALSLAQKESQKNLKMFSSLQSIFIKEVSKKIPKATLNGPHNAGDKHPGIVNFCFPEIDSEQAILILDSFGIRVSPSSSCQNLAERSNSYVVEALGMDKCAFSSIRFSFGKFTKKSDIKSIVQYLEKAVAGATNKRIRLV